MAILWDLCRWSIICHQQLWKQLIVVSEQSAGLSRRFAITCARAQVRRAQPAGLPSLLLALLVYFSRFFIFLKSDQPWRPKIDGFIMENTPITIARTYWEFSLSLTLIKKSGQNLQISQWKNYFCKRQGCKIEKNVDWVLNPFCRIPIEILWHFYSS